MIIDRQHHWNFLEDAITAEVTDFKTKFETKAETLLQDTSEIFVAQLVAFRKEGDMVVRFPITRTTPRRRQHLIAMILPHGLRNYRNWGDMTYEDLYKSRFCSTECMREWQHPSGDGQFMLVGFRGYSLEFEEMIRNVPFIIIIFAPQIPPIQYLSNLQKIVEDKGNWRIKEILDSDYKHKLVGPELIANNSPEFIINKMHENDVIIVQGPPGTGKTYMLSEICRHFSRQGKSILVTSLTNRALMELASKEALADLVSNGFVYKTNLTSDEQKELANLLPMESVQPSKGRIVLSTFYVTSEYAILNSTSGAFDIVVMDEASQAFLQMFAAAYKIGKKNIWVGDTKQLPPIVKINEDFINAKSYATLINGMKTISDNVSFPIYQLTQSYRFGNRTARYTGIFYNDTLLSNLVEAPNDIALLGGKVYLHDGPSLLELPMDMGDYTPNLAISAIVSIIHLLREKEPNADIAVLTCMVKTVLGLETAIMRETSCSKKIIIETVARVQGLTVDYTIFLIPNVAQSRSLEPRLFNVATSRARKATVIIADRNIWSKQNIDKNVERYLNELKN